MSAGKSQSGPPVLEMDQDNDVRISINGDDPSSKTQQAGDRFIQRLEEEAEARLEERNNRVVGAEDLVTQEAKGALEAADGGGDEAAIQLTEEEKELLADKLKKIEDSFDVFDMDHGGTIELEETKDILYLVDLPTDDDNVSKVCKLLGMKDDKIDRETFVKSFIPIATGRVTDSPLNVIYEAIQRGDVLKLKIAFEACDMDHSNEIDVGEFREVLKSLGEELKEEQVQKMFNELDTSGDGKVSFEEFIKYMCRRKGEHVKGGMKYFNLDALSAISSFMGDKKISDAEQAEAVKALPTLERLGVRYVKQAYRRKEVKKGKVITKPPHEVHILNEEERGQVKSIEYWTILADCGVGLVCSGITAISEFSARQSWNVDGTSDDLTDEEAARESLSFSRRLLYYWLVVAFVTIFFSILEIVLIYVVHINIKLSKEPGLRLFPVDKERSFITAGLARAALELPHPKGEDLGVDPLEEASKTRLALAALVYKLRTGVATFVIRLIIKRVATRAAIRGADAFAAIPVSIFFDGMIGYKCTRQARVIALGPSVAVQLVNSLFDPKGKMTKPLRIALMRAIACAIVGNEEMHPNLRILLNAASAKLDLSLSHEQLQDESRRQKESENEKKAEVTEPRSPTNDPLLIRDHSIEMSEAPTLRSDTTRESIVSDTDQSEKSRVGGKKTKHKPKGKEGIYRPGKPTLFVEALKELPPTDQKFVVQVFALGLILDGHVSGKLLKLFKRVCAACYLEGDEWMIRWLIRQFLAGQLYVENLLNMFEEEQRQKYRPSGCKEKFFYYMDRLGVLCAC